jgi:hypothetical protein
MISSIYKLRTEYPGNGSVFRPTILLSCLISDWGKTAEIMMQFKLRSLLVYQVGVGLYLAYVNKT